MSLRQRTIKNRSFGITAGQQRREAVANREELSQTRRSEVFRQDVEHTGNAGDPIRSHQRATREAKLTAAEPTVLAMRAAGETYTQMQEATGLSQANVAAILSRNGLIGRRR